MESSTDDAYDRMGDMICRSNELSENGREPHLTHFVTRYVAIVGEQESKFRREVLRALGKAMTNG